MVIRKYTVVIALVALWYIFFAPPQAVAQVLDDIEVTGRNGSTVIQVNFAVPVRYIKHFPTEPAKTLRVYLRVTPSRDSSQQQVPERRTLRAPPGGRVPLLDVTYERDAAAEPQLVVRFSEPVQVTIRQGQNSRSIQIIVPTPMSQRQTPPISQTERSPSQKAPETSGVFDRILDTLKQESAKKQPNTGKKQANTGKGRYTVTLALSFKPITDIASIRKDLAEFQDHIVYQITATLFGLKVYFIRLGFFASSDEATVARAKLQSKYPAAWVTLVTKDERIAALGGKKIKPKKRKGFKLTEVPKGLVSESKKESFDKEYPYVITLASYLDSNPEPLKPLPKSLEKYRLYTTAFIKDGKSWRRLRLGFFTTSAQAQQVRQRVKDVYPDAWIDIVSRIEREDSEKTALVLGDPKFALREPEAEVVAESNAPQLLAQGREALTSGDNIQAIRLFTKILVLPKSEYTQEAQEYLGLARERDGQIASAKVEYKLYLKLYPDGEGAARVRQRLANLSRPKETVRIVELRKPKEKEVHEWSMFGSLTQDYYRGESQTDITTTVGNIVSQDSLSEVDQSSLQSNFDLTGRFRNTRFDNRMVFRGNQTHDFLDSENDSRVTSAYFNLLNRPHHYAAKIGRQSGTYGVLSRFDGGLFGHNFLPKWRINAFAGLPADDIAPESDRRFYGVGIDMGPFADRWNTSLYIIDQEVDGMTDRQAVGAELRYFDPKRSLFSLVDYDVYFSELNIAMFQGSWQLPTSTTLNLLLDYRKSPSLQTTNALLGQIMESAEELLATKSEEEVKEMAEALTATSQLFTIGAVHPLNKRLQLGGDITIANISATEAVDNVPAAEETGNVVTYSTQLIGSRFFFSDDVSVSTLSYTDSESFKARALSFIERFPFSKSWRGEVGLKIYDQENDIGSDLLRITPTFKLYYRGRKNFTFEFEVAQEQRKVRGDDDDEDTTRDFVRLGYRRDF